MSKIDNMCYWMYESDYEAINMFITESAQEHGGICDKKGFDTALAYLCINNIKHSYSIVRIHNVVLVNLNWWEGGEEQNLIFWGAGDIE